MKRGGQGLMHNAAWYNPRHEKGHRITMADCHVLMNVTHLQQDTILVSIALIHKLLEADLPAMQSNNTDEYLHDLHKPTENSCRSKAYPALCVPSPNKSLGEKWPQLQPPCGWLKAA